MTATVRYRGCRGPGVIAMVAGADKVIIRIVKERDRESCVGYVALNEAEPVLEKSDGYGAFEGYAEWADEQLDDCAPVTRGDFSWAWSRPYARRSLWRRFLARLNGASDAKGDPSQQDLSTEPPPSHDAP